MELIVATSIIVILSLAAVSIGDLINQRDREVRLRQALLDMRSAIDRYRTIRNGTLPTSIGILLTATDSEGIPFLRKFPDNPVALFPGTYWQIATRTYEIATQTRWFPNTAPYLLMATTTYADGIADIRCSEYAENQDIGNGLNNYPYESW